jgi:hypothetical protein
MKKSFQRPLMLLNFEKGCYKYRQLGSEVLKQHQAKVNADSNHQTPDLLIIGRDGG